MKKAFLSSAWRARATTADLQVRYSTGEWGSTEFGELVDEDFNMVMASILFVWSYIMFHTGAFALACLGMLMIILSLPVALFWYVTVANVPYFSQLL